jgi:hypothetical protein
MVMMIDSSFFDAGSIQHRAADILQNAAEIIAAI